MRRVPINKTFLQTALACYKDDISNSTYFIGPLGTMFTAIKSLLTILNISTFSLKSDMVSLCKTPAQIKSSKTYLPSSTVVNLNTLQVRYFVSFRNLCLLAILVVLSIFLSIKLRHRGILRATKKVKFISELSFSMEIVAAVLCMKYGKIFKDQSIEVVLCSDHNAFFIALCLLSNSEKFSFLPHGPNIGADNKFRHKNIFNKIYCVCLLQLVSFTGWEPENQYIELKANAKDWMISSAKGTKDGHDGLVIWFTQLDFFDNEYVKIKHVLRDILHKNSKISNNIHVVFKGIQLKKVQDLMNSNIDDSVVNFHYSFVDIFETFYTPLDFHKKLHVVFNSAVSIDLCHQGLDLIVLNNNPLVTDHHVKKFLEKTYYEITEIDKDYVAMERIRNGL